VHVGGAIVGLGNELPGLIRGQGARGGETKFDGQRHEKEGLKAGFQMGEAANRARDQEWRDAVAFADPLHFSSTATHKEKANLVP